MSRSITKKDSGKIFYFDINAEVQGKNQWLFDDEFLVYTTYNPLLDWSNKLILKGNFTYKGNDLDSALITEIALFYIQRLPDGSIEEHGYGYKYGEGIAGDTNNPLHIKGSEEATEVSFHYSNHEYRQNWISGILASFPISNDRSVIEESIFGNYVHEGWIDNPFDTVSSLSDSQVLNYIASNDDLIAAFGVDIEAAKSHYTNYGISEGRSLTSFSASDYLKKYSDLKAAFGDDQNAALKHYIQFGFKEGRTVSSTDSGSDSGSDSGLGSKSSSNLTDLEAYNYIASNNDLISAFGLDIEAAKSHYMNYGESEGRSLTSFSPTRYLEKYSDLKAVFGDDETSALKHYIQFGFKEGRTDTASTGSNTSSDVSSNLTDFEALNYIASHDDLINAYGTDTDSAISHYKNYGKSEGRTLDDFDEWEYLASNNDLMNAFGSNTTEAIKHYISYGKSEGRVTNLFNAETYLNNYPDLKNAFGDNEELATKHYVEYGFNEGRAF